MSKHTGENARKQFIAGNIDRWHAGIHGYTVKCVVEEDQLKIKWTQPRRRQWRLENEDGSPKANTTDNRRLLTDLAIRDVAEYRVQPQAKRPDVSQSTPSSVPLRTTASSKFTADVEAPSKSVLTMEVPWDLYIRAKWKGIPDGYEGWGREEVRTYYSGLTEEDQRGIPSADSLFVILQSRRRVLEYP